MDSGNGNNPQQQRYCSTPIMAPPSVATSPPVMGSMHQPTHHPPPAISPHPYYSHHTGGSSHYPTPSPTPPPPPPSMHHQQHQQYYQQHPHPYYGSHQPTQQTQPPPQQQSHHGMPTHSGMTSSATAPPPPQSQHPHNLIQGSYHHPQSHQQQQQWATPSPHTHPQQQAHHGYYHQQTHHPPPQQQPQQHGYPPPPHSPYPPYSQAHSSTITPPPPQPQQIIPHPPPVPASPGPSQIHQQQQQGQGPPPQSQSHALNNLSRFVNQSTIPSPRASPSLSHQQHQHSLHQQQQQHQLGMGGQMGAHSPSPFGGHMEHHVTMNGHSSSMGPSPTPPVMSPPPQNMGHVQQAMSPPPSMSVPVQQQQHQQHHLPPQSPIPYNVNVNGGGGGGGGGNMVMERERHSSLTKSPSVSPAKQRDSFRGLETNPDTNLSKDHHDMHNMFSDIPDLSSPSGSGLGSKDIDNINNVSAVMSEPTPLGVGVPMPMTSSSSASASNLNCNSNIANNNDSVSGNSSESSFPSSSPVRRESIDSGYNNIPTTPQHQHHDIPRPNGSGGSAENTPKGSGSNNMMMMVDGEHSRSSSVSPLANPMGSPTNAGNGHQMMPVRLQNMQKGARTKASMKKLMQEQHITTPNGQASDGISDGLGISGKDIDAEHESVEGTATPKGKGKSPKAKSPRKRKSQTSTLASSDTNSANANANEALSQPSDLSQANDSTGLVPPLVIKPGYTRKGKKIGRPRKGSTAMSSSADDESSAIPIVAEKTKTKGKGKKASTAAPPAPAPATTTTPLKQGGRKEVSTTWIDGVQITEFDSIAPTDFEMGDGDGDVNESHEVAEESIIEETVVNTSHKAKRSSPKRKGGKYSRKRPSKVLSDSSDLKQVTNDLSSLVPSSDIVDINALQLTSNQSQNESIIATSPKGKKRARTSKSRKSKSDAIIIPSPDTASGDPIPTSEISEQVAKSVAGNCITNVSATATPKSRRRGKKSEPSPITVESEPVTEVNPALVPITPTKKRASPKKILISPLKETEISPERGGDLPRLRSRSPKQNESPPLRVSSPRAAKERSTTPASTTTSGNQRSPRASRSREKETATSTPVTTPLASPALRSPKKTPEKVQTVLGGTSTRPSKSRKQNESLDQKNEYLSPPPVKRTRQISKESAEEAQPPEKMRRTTSARKVTTEVRASVDSDMSLSSAEKRSNRRRKSGSVSVSGSTDRESLASPSFNQSQSGSSLVSLPPPLAEISFDVSSELNNETVNNSVVVSPKKRAKKSRKGPLLTSRKGKRKARRGSKSAKAITVLEASIAADKQSELNIHSEENRIPLAPQPENMKTELGAPRPLIEGVQDPAPAVGVQSTPTKAKRAKKQNSRKGKKDKKSPVSHDAYPNPDEEQQQNQVLIMDSSQSQAQANGENLSQEIVNAGTLSPSASKQKGKRKTPKKSKQKSVSSMPAPSADSVLVSPIPVPTVPPKKGKTKQDNKQPRSRQSKKSQSKTKNNTALLAPSVSQVPSTVELGKDPYQFDSSDVTGTGSSTSMLTDEESKAKSGFVFSPPPELVLGRRRRSSAAKSPVNTQINSAKVATETGTTESPTKVKSDELSVPSTSGTGAATATAPNPGPSPKPTVAKATPPARRDSRSVSKEFDYNRVVSVVLSDIARSAEFLNITGPTDQAHSSTLLSPPFSQNASVPVGPTPPSTTSPQPGTSTGEQVVPPIKVKKQRKSLKGKSTPLVANIGVEEKVLEGGEKKKKPRKRKPKITMTNTPEFLERKATLEAEVARALLELKSGSSGASSKSPSPAKSILGVDTNEGTTPTLLLKLPKKRSRTRPSKLGKRRKSASSKLSVDVGSSGIATTTQESIELSISSTAEGVSTSEGGGLLVPVPKKRKTVKARRSSAKSKSKKLSILPIPGGSSYLNLNSSTSLAESSTAGQSINFSHHSSPGTSGLPVKVAKTAVIPTASSLGIQEPLPSPIVPPVVGKVKLKIKKEKKETPAKVNRKTSQSLVSPDITAGIDFGLASGAGTSVGITATSTPVPKVKRKKSTKTPAVKIEPNSQNLSASSSAVMWSADGTVGESSGVEVPVKKKRQRKPKLKVSSETSLASSTVPPPAIPSTSSSTLARTSPTSSPKKLFPYQVNPIPYKKPILFAKSIPGLVSMDEIQKVKQKDGPGPSLRVLGGLVKFYRGEEEEEIDPDPRLPKEKGQLPTDAAVPWLCSFCHLGPHAQKLGDLFGPYFADLPPVYGNAPKRETWMHGDCGLWAGRLVLIGTYLKRLEETLVNADKETCGVCKLTGATIGCLKRRCKEAAHFPCAIRKSWKIDEDNFHSYCPKHSAEMEATSNTNK